MYTCDQALELLSARMDGALTPEEAAGLEEHLASCPDCRALAADLETLHAAMPGLYQAPPPELKERVMARISEEKAPISLEEVRRKQGRKWRSWGAMAAVVAVVFMSAAAMRFGGTPGVPEAAPVNSTQLYSAQPEAGEPDAADQSASRDTEEAADTQGDSGTAENRIQTAQSSVVSEGENGSVKAAMGTQTPQVSRNDETADKSDGEGGGKTMSVTPFCQQSLTGKEGTEGAENGALQTVSDPMAAAERIYEEILSVDWPTATAAADQSLTGYALTSADGVRSAVLRYLRESENGRYSIFKLYTETDGETLNFYAVPLEGGDILIAWADNTPGDDAAFWDATEK